MIKCANRDPVLKKQVLALISKWPELREKSFILLDGDSGVCKTRVIAPVLKKYFAPFKKLVHIKVDEHLLGNGKPIAEQVKRDDVCRAISRARRRCILDTVCALQILDLLKTKMPLDPDYHIFVGLRGGPVGGMKKELLAYRKDRKPLCHCCRRLEIDESGDILEVLVRQTSLGMGY